MRMPILFLAAGSILMPGSARAGDVGVGVTGGVLRLTGGAGNEIVTIDQVGLASATQFRVTPGGGTTVNGAGAAQVFSGVTGDIRIELGDGTDSARFQDATAPDDLRFVAGVNVASSLETERARIEGDLRVTGGGSATALNCADTIIGGDLRFRGGAGADACNLNARCIVAGNFSARTGGDGDGVSIRTSWIGGATSIRLESGNADEVRLDKTRFDGDVKCTDSLESSVVDVGRCTIDGDLTAQFGPGDQTWTITDCEISGAVRYTCGDGLADGTVSATGIDGGLRVEAGVGNDSIDLLSGVGVGGDLQLDLGDGTNSFTFAGASCGGDLRAEFGAGGDECNVNDVVCHGDVRFTLGAAPGGDQNSLHMDSARIGGSLVVTGALSADVAQVQRTDVRSEVRVILGDGVNVAQAIGVAASALRITTGSGNDTIVVADESRTRGDARIVAGEGNDAITVASDIIGDDLIVRAGGGADTVNVSNVIVNDKTDVTDP